MEAPRDEENRIIMSPEYLKYLCENEGQYANPKLNTQLYLNNQGFYKISCLEPYVNIEALWLQTNVIEKIEGLSTLVNLKFLYLQNNLIEKIERLESCSELVRIDLSDNRIQKIEGLSTLKNLKELKLENNAIETFDNLKGILDVKESLTFLNLARNKIQPHTEIVPLFHQMNKLSSLYLNDNPFVNTMKNYRKTFIVSMPWLGYFDGNLIEEYERIYAEAFFKGGQKMEQEARKKYFDTKQIAAQKRKEDEKEYYKGVDERIKRTLNLYRQTFIEDYRNLIKKREELAKNLWAEKTDYKRNMLKIIKVEKDIKRMIEENGEFLKGEPKVELKYWDLNVEDYIDSISAPEDYVKIQENMVKELEELKSATEKGNMPKIKKEESENMSDIPIKEEKKQETIITKEIPKFFDISEEPKNSENIIKLESKEEDKIPDLEKIPNIEKFGNFPTQKFMKNEFKWTEEIEKEFADLTVKNSFDFATVHKELKKNHSDFDLEISDLCKKWAEIEGKNYREPLPEKPQNLKIEELD